MGTKKVINTATCLFFSLTVFFLYSHYLKLFPDFSHWLLLPSWLQIDVLNLHIAVWLFLAFTTQLLLSGLVLDRLGIYFTLFLSACLCLLGILFFVNSEYQTYFNLMGRVLVISGLAYMLLGCLKITAGSMPSYYLSLAIGLFLTIFLLNSDTNVENVSSSSLVARVIITYTGSGLLFLTIFLSLKNKTAILGAGEKPTWLEISSVLRNSQNWLLSLYSGLSVAPVIILTSYSVRPFFQESYLYDNHETFILSNFVFIGLALGALLIGFIHDRVSNRRSIMQAGIMVQEISFILLIYMHYHSFGLSSLLALFVGLGGSIFILSYLIGKETNNVNVAGLVMTIINLGIVSIATLTFHLFGKFLAWDWDGKVIDGLCLYSSFDYHIAFMIFPIYLLLGYILLLSFKDPI